MKVLVDENITYGKEAFSHFGEVITKAGREITNSDLLDKDLLIVRSVTKVDENLLKNTPIKFVGTTTIGKDHIDEEYLKLNKIEFDFAEGCNSNAVNEYVFSIISRFIKTNKKPLNDYSIGIVGHGNIGSKVAKVAKSLGMKVLISDPPKFRNGVIPKSSSLSEILKCDIVTFHVPLNKGGIDNTFHLLSEKNIIELDTQLLINCSRGPVVSNKFLLEYSKINNLFIALDVWEPEPDINIDLLDMVKIGTAHIAGYSFEGKVNGTEMIYKSACKFFNKHVTWKPIWPSIQNNIIKLDKNMTNEECLINIFNHVYDVEKDSNLLKEIIGKSEKNRVGYFDHLRKNYCYRRELKNYSITDCPESFIKTAKTFRMTIL